MTILLLLAIALLLLTATLELAFLDFTINELYRALKRYQANEAAITRKINEQ